MKTVIGVDPGKNGAYAVISEGILIKVVPFEGEIINCRSLAHVPTHSIVVERVTASPQQGVVSAFTFGRYSEAVTTAAYLNPYAGGKVRMVRPVEWQTALGCLSGGDKKVTFAKAKLLFPNAHNMKMFDRDSADAVLIAQYAYKIAMAI